MDERTGFHIVVRPWRILLGLALGLGYLLLLQQYGVTTFTTGKLVLYMIIGVVVAIAMPTLATLIPRRAAKAPAESPKEGGAQ
jgi:hypothetical protein